MNLEIKQCAACQTRPDRSCPVCHGAVSYAQVGTARLFWGTPKHPGLTDSIKYRRLSRKVNAVIFMINLLVVFGLFIWSIGQGENFNILNIWLVSNTITWWFWVAVLALMVTSFRYFYRPRQLAPTINYSQLKTNDIDVAKSCDEGLVLAIEQTLEQAKRIGVEPDAKMLLYTCFNFDKFIWLLVKLEVEAEPILQYIKFWVGSQPKVEGGQVGFPETYDELMIKAYVRAAEAGSREVSFYHILPIMAAENPDILALFTEQKKNLNDINTVCEWADKTEKQIASVEEYRQKSRFKPAGHMNRAWTARPTPILDAFSTDLTYLAKIEQLDHLVDRVKEQDKVLDVLEKTSQNSVLFVGEAGVGKATIVNGVAYRMAAEEVPDLLKDKRLIALNAAQMFASGSEQLFIRALQEAVRARNIILFIDDLHLLAGIKMAGSGQLDALGVLTETLTKYQLQFIASTTLEGYSKYITTYESLINQFTRVDIEEVTPEIAIEIVKSAIYRIENRQKVLITYPAIKAAVELSNDLILDKKLPSKVFDLLEECAVVVQKRGDMIVRKSDVVALLQEKTKVPIEEVTQTESTKLLNLENILHERVIGQDVAVKQVADAIKRARAGLKDKRKPIATFLFVGPTGVGKTELAKTLAAEYFGDEERMIRLDMSEYQELGDIKKIIGAPPGSADFEERGYLTEAVKRSPYSLILLDELEKAHSDILNLFLQVLDEGQIKDSLGRVVKFNNCIIIATSNAGTALIQQGIRDKLPVPQIEAALMEELKKYYRPEFLNRFDGVIMFKPLETPQIKQIAKLMIDKINHQMQDKKITVEVTDQALDQFISEGYNQEFGARALYRTLQDKVKNVMAEKMLSGELTEGGRLIISGEGRSEIA